MTTNRDDGTVRAAAGSDVVTLNREDYDRLLAGDAGANPAPAVEEGPHLADPAVRAAKRGQLLAAGVGADDEAATDDMRSIVAEEG